MKAFRLSEYIDKNKIFLVNLSELDGFLSPLFYKSTPVRHSNIKELREIAFVNPTRKRPVFEEDELVPYVGLPETDEHTHAITNVVLRPYKEVAGRGVIYPNEVLFARIEPSIFNKKYILTNDLHGYDFAFTSTEFYVAQPKHTSAKYLIACFLTKYVHNQVSGKTTGSTGRRRLDSGVFARLLIPFPSKEKQGHAEQIFTNALKKKETKEQQAKDLLATIDDYLLGELGIKIPELDNSLENRIFDVNFSKVSGNRFDPKLYVLNAQRLFVAVENSPLPKISLKSLLSQSVSGEWGLDENTEVSEDQYKKCVVIRATEFDNNFNLNVENSRVKYRKIKKDKLNQLDVRQNDFLLEKSGGSLDQPVGRIAFLDKSILDKYSPICFSNFIQKLRVDESKVLPEYLFCYLKTIHNIKITEVMQSQTSGIRNLIMREYFNQSVVLPSTCKQNEIAEKVGKMRDDAFGLFQDAERELEKASREVEQIIIKK